MSKKSRRQILLEREGYRFLEFRTETKSKEPYIKGTGRIRVSDVFYWVRTNKKSPKKLAVWWQVPVEAIYEALRWADENREVLRQEAKKEWKDFLKWAHQTGYLERVRLVRGKLPPLPFQDEEYMC